jgi:hypothetical protein
MKPHSRHVSCLLLLAVSLLAPSTPTSAQTSAAATAAPAATASLTGRVQNAATGQHLNNARLAVKGTNLVAFTDETGSYRLDRVPAGSKPRGSKPRGSTR